MKNKRSYIAMSTATLTQSGMLAALLKHQRSKVIELAQHRAQRERMHAVLRSNFPWLSAAANNVSAALRLRRDLAEATIQRRT